MKSPWKWVPTLYFAEGLPYFAVNTLTVIMFTRLGMPLKDMAFYTGWLYLPWVIKPFWSPFVDIFKTKRLWTLSMQLLIAICMGIVAFILPTGIFFSVTLAVFWFMAFFSATHDIAADGYYMIELTPHKQAAFVGVRSTFYRVASVFGQGGLVIIAGYLEETTSDIRMSWSIVFLIISVLFAVLFFYHCRFMPVSKEDRPLPGVSPSTVLKDFGQTFVTFFQRQGVGVALAFMLLYRLPEALCLKVIQPFMIAPLSAGGLGLSTAEIGFANGTAGVIALLGGGIAGGVAISRFGLKKMLWSMALSLSLPCVLYCVLASLQPEDFIWTCIAVSAEQFGYGFGFSAYMLYLIYFCQGESQTSHYAFCTAFMALGMMLPGMAAGWIFELSGGYGQYFWIVMVSCIATLAVCSLLKINPSFGKKQ